MYYDRDWDYSSEYTDRPYRGRHDRGVFGGLFPRQKERVKYTRSSNQWLAGICIIMLVTVLLQLVGFSTPEWMSITFNETIATTVYIGISQWGLWEIKQCTTIQTPSAGRTECETVDWKEDAPNFLKDAQALECVGLVLLLLGTVLVGSMLFMRSHTDIRNITILCNVAAGSFILIGGIVFWEKFQDEFDTLQEDQIREMDYSLILCFVAGSLAIVIGPVMGFTVHQRRRKRFRGMTPPPPPREPMPMIPRPPTYGSPYATMPHPGIMPPPSAYGPYTGYPSHYGYAAPY